MRRSGAHGTLGDRLGLSASEAPAASPGARVKHCWVVDPQHGRLPGLLLEWRSVDGAWRGRVVRPTLERGTWVVVEEWLEAGLLEPAERAAPG